MKRKTISERLFEQFCGMNALPCERIPEDGDYTPDYVVTLCGTRVIVEIKELTPNEDEEQVIRDSRTKLPGEFHFWGGTLGKRVRSLIEKAKRQLERFAAGKCPGILLLYDARPPPFRGILSLNGTEIGAGMYGFETIDLHEPKDHVGDMRFGIHRFGKGKKVGPDYRSYISTIGVLREPNASGQSHVDLYLNVYADPENPLPVRKIAGRNDFTVYTLPSGGGNEYQQWAKVESGSHE